MRAVVNLAAAGVLAAATIVGGYAVAGRGDAEPPKALGPEPVTVVVDVEHSLFEPSSLRVEVGTEVRFVLVNGDPINHELIVGPADVHARHSTGKEPWHPPKPGEASVGPNDRAVTTYVFDEPGTIEMACHLPGHYEHGMRGEIEVIDGERSTVSHPSGTVDT